MKKNLILLLTVLLSALILIIGYFAVGGNAAYEAIGSGLEYCRAEVCDIIRIEEYEMSYDIVFSAKITSGSQKGKTVEATQNVITGDVRNARDVSLNDKILIFCGGSDNEQWFFGQYIRSDVLVVLLVIFLICLVLFGRGKGLKTVASLALTVAAIFAVLIPAIINCKNIYLWGLVTAFYIVLMTLAIVNGLNRLSLSATLGCMCGVLVSAFLVAICDGIMQLSGIIDECSVYILYIGNGGTIDLRALMFASIIIGAVGAVMDVAVNISASLHEIAVKVRRPSFTELVRSGITIGRDIVGTMSNTLILAYMGSSMCSILLYVYNLGDSMLNLFNREQIVVEVLKILVGSMGILLTLPMTTVISAFLYSRESYVSTLEKMSYLNAAKERDEFSEELCRVLNEENRLQKDDGTQDEKDER